jgi:hypothetical protein
LALLVPLALGAQELEPQRQEPVESTSPAPGTRTPPVQEPDHQASGTQQANSTEQAETPAATSPCLPAEGTRSHAVIDQIQRGVYRTVCTTARWFDNLFGEEHPDDVHEPVWGRLLVGAHWDERDGLEDEIHFRAEFDLPKLESRMNAFVGRSNREDEVSDRNIATSALPEILSLPDDDEWLVGLGYHPLRSQNSRFDVDLGVDIESPLNPYVKARYQHRHTLGQHNLFNVRHTAFWEDKDGVGFTERIDVDHLLGEDSMVRWRTIGTYSETTDGIDWRSQVTLYYQLSNRRALAFEVGAFGETDHEVEAEDLFVRTIYRQRISRDWLFVDVRPGVAWRRRARDEPREAVPFVTFGVELLYGKPR